MTNVFKPKSEAEISDAVRKLASTKTPLEIIGGGTKLGLGNQVDTEHRVHTGGVTGIQLYEPGALTVVAKSGTPLTTLEKLLADEGQHLPFEPPDYRNLLGSNGEPTIGGIVACGISGPRRIQTGACRDALIGVRFISSSGDIIKNGGRVMKNVTGYDLVKLMCGSYGTLGILTEVAFKLLPKPEQAGVVLLKGLADDAAIAAMSLALTSPFDVSGAAHIQKDSDGEPTTLIRIEGFEKSVSYRAGKIKELLADCGAPDIEIGEDAASNSWKRIRDVEMFSGRDGAVWKLSVKSTDAAAIVDDIRRSLSVEAMYDWGGGLVWLLVEDAEDCGASIIRGRISQSGGHATLMRSSAGQRKSVQAFQPELPGIARLSAAIRNQFDPHNIFNPGRVGEQR